MLNLAKDLLRQCGLPSDEKPNDWFGVNASRDLSERVAENALKSVTGK
jgi:hypothetical protein